MQGMLIQFVFVKKEELQNRLIYVRIYIELPWNESLKICIYTLKIINAIIYTAHSVLLPIISRFMFRFS